MQELRNKVAVITGSGRGIGAVIAYKLAMEGAKIILWDKNNTFLKKRQEELKKHQDVEIYITQVDVSDRLQVEKAKDMTLEKFDTIDILINNAGICRVCPINELDEATWDQIIDTNLKGVYLSSNAFIPQMIKQKSGKIVNISSMAGKIGGRWMTAYSAAKAGVIGFTKSLAREVAKYNINVNCVCPGIVPTQLWHECITDHAKKIGIEKKSVNSYYISNIPLGRLCTPEDVSNIVFFLVSTASSYMTGQALNITGGQQMD